MRSLRTVNAALGTVTGAAPAKTKLCKRTRLESCDSENIRNTEKYILRFFVRGLARTGLAPWRAGRAGCGALSAYSANVGPALAARAEQTIP